MSQEARARRSGLRCGTQAATPTPALCVKGTLRRRAPRPARGPGGRGRGGLSLLRRLWWEVKVHLVAGRSRRPQSRSRCFRAVSGVPGAPTCPQARNYVSQVLQIGAAEVTASLRPGEEQEGPCPSLGERRGRQAWIKGLSKSPAPYVVCSQHSPYTPAHPVRTPPGAWHRLARHRAASRWESSRPRAISCHSRRPPAVKICPSPVS